MISDSLLPFTFPAVGRKKVTVAFDGGWRSADVGWGVLMAQAESGCGRPSDWPPAAMPCRTPPRARVNAATSPPRSNLAYPQRLGLQPPKGCA